MAENFIQVIDLEKTFLSGENKIAAVKKCSLSINKGEQIAVMGPSGSGKSTFLSLLGGLAAPTSGRITVGGFDYTSASDKEMTAFRRDNIGFVFQSYNLIPEMTAKQNIILPLKLGGKTYDKEHFDSICRELNISDRLTHLPSELSGGQQQRVAIARALITEPSLLLCDEPTGNLDSASGNEVMELLLGLSGKTGSTLIVVTHDESVAAQLQRVIHIYDGEISEV